MKFQLSVQCPDAFIPVVIRFTAHRLYRPDCGETWVEKIPFLSKPTSRSTRQLEKTIVALRGDMSTSYAKWVKDFLGEDTDIVYDHFHVIKSMNDKTDKVRRRTMNKQDADLKKIIKGQRRTLTKNTRKASSGTGGTGRHATPARRDSTRRYAGCSSRRSATATGSISD